MSDHIHALALPRIRALSPYVPGKPIDELARELGLDPADIVKLASNENPMGPNPRILAAIRRAARLLTRYPDGNGFELKAKLGERFGIDAAQITLGNGSNDIIVMVAEAFLAEGRNAVFSQYGFAAYPLATQASGAECREVAAKAWGNDLEGMLTAIDGDTRVIFIANPNNPTGSWVDRQDLERFLARVPGHVLVVLDEAYIEYADDASLPDGLDYVASHPNLLVSRSLCKAYGLAGLRVGYAVSSREVADLLNRVRQPFNVNSLALAGACAALDDDAYLEAGRRVNRHGLAQLQAGLDALGLSWIPMRANFVTVDLGMPAQPVYQSLLRQGVIVRPLDGYGLPGHLRVSVGLDHENRSFLDALAIALKESGHAAH